MKHALLIAAVLALTGCGLTPQGDAVREFLKMRGQKAADQTAQNARDYLCIYARVGSVSKLFQSLQDRMAWQALCTEAPPMSPPPIHLPVAPGGTEI